MTYECPICKSKETALFLTRESIPVQQNILCESKEDAQKIPRGDLSLYFCSECHFVFNANFDLTKLNYEANYNNNQMYSHIFEAYVKELVDYLLESEQIEDKSIVEVGCGKGYFISRLIEQSKSNIGYGFDPSYEGEETKYNNRLKFIKKFYDDKFKHIQANIVISRHVIEHVPDPVGLLMAIRDASSEGVKVYIETPCLNWVLKNTIIWDFFYEHCSYFNSYSINNLFNKVGFKVSKIDHVFNDQYLWVEATVNKHQPSRSVYEKETYTLITNYKQNEKRSIEKWKNKVNELSNRGKVFLWGAGAKGVTFCNLIDPRCTKISGVVDINPSKQNKFIPGTGHMIISDKQALEMADTILVMNNNYIEEISEYVLKSRSNIEIIGTEI